MDNAIAIVMAAGKGTRMKSELPKVLCEANGRPLVEYVIDALRTAGVGGIVAVVGYKADLVEQRLSGVSDIQFALQAQQLGTGHAVMMCREQLASHDGPVVVVAGDSPMMQASSIAALLDEYQRVQPACILGTLIHDDPTGLGRIVRNESGEFIGIVEHKDASESQLKINEVNMSTYIFDNQKMLAALDGLSNKNSQQEYYITDLPALLLSNNEDVRALPILKSIEALSVNTVDQLADVEKAMNDAAG